MSVRAAATVCGIYVYYQLCVEVSEAATHLRLSPRAPPGAGRGSRTGALSRAEGTLIPLPGGVASGQPRPRGRAQGGARRRVRDQDN
eukprot:scaffold356_cov69-Phaeocystis_antarctica.AAC.2